MVLNYKLQPLIQKKTNQSKPDNIPIETKLYRAT